MRTSLLMVSLAMFLFFPVRVLATEAPPSPPTHRIVAYYFHGDQRCRTCLHIESSGLETLQERFSKDLAAGRLEWHTVNLDQPENDHYVQDFQLVTRAIVLVELKDGKQVRYKTLDKVWQLIHDENAFRAYVRDQVEIFLRALGE